MTVGQMFKHGMTPHQIYQDLTTGPGSNSVDYAQATAKFFWDAEDERAQLIRKQAELIRTGWQGTASEGAFGAAQPLAASALSRVDELDRAQDLLDRQSGSFHRAKNSVKPVPPEPPEPNLLDPASVFVDYEKDVKTYQSDSQHNIEVFHGYDGASDYNETNIPSQYSTVHGSGSPISVTSDSTQQGGAYIDVPDTTQPRKGTDSGPPPSERLQTGTGPISGPSNGPNNGPGSGPVPGLQPPRQTTPSDFVPPPVNTPGFGSPTPGPTPGGQLTGLPVGYYPVTGGGVSGPGARGGTYGGSGEPAPGSAGRGGPGMRGGALGAGSGVGALAAEEAAAQRAAAAAAARGTGSGMMGGAPVGAGKGKGDEDEEHQRKVLIEADAEGVFGSDVLTAPQVIGDDEYEDD